jgi:hypothetical protein
MELESRRLGRGAPDRPQFHCSIRPRRVEQLLRCSRRCTNRAARGAALWEIVSSRQGKSQGRFVYYQDDEQDAQAEASASAKSPDIAGLPG